MSGQLSENIYEHFFTVSPDMLCVAGLDGFFKEVNPKFCEVLGYSKEHLLSKRFVEFIHPDDVDKTVREVEKLATGETSLYFENRYLAADGHYCVLSWSAYPDPKVGAIYATARDVTKQYMVQSKFTQLKEALRKETIFVETDVNGVITEVNDKFCEISGYSEQELLGNTHNIVNSGVHSKEFFEELWQTISSGKIWSGTIINRSKSGSMYYVESIIIPTFSPSGKIDSYIAIRYDITDKVFNESELHKILQILNETSAIAKTGGWELDAKTGELSWTDETFKILGVEKKEGRNPVLPEGLQLFTDKHKPIIDEAVSRALEFGEPYALELESQSPCGEIKWIFTNGKPNYKDGELISISGTIQDIHDKKLGEIKLQKERQKSIQNAKFAALGELAASVAHEINNPLGIISGYAELMQQLLGDDDPKRFNKKLDTILKSCSRITHIVQSLRRFSRTEEEVEHQMFSLPHIIDEAITLTRPKLKRDMVELRFNNQIEADILCNEIEIEQVMINLINNAVDAIRELPEKWIDISIVENELSFELFVKDSGAGIPEQVRLKMFEPFYTTKKVNEGTGLGLSVVQGIIEEHNGSIRVCPEVDNTCFVISFPKRSK